VLARDVGLVVVDAGIDLRGDVVGEREALRDRRGVALGELTSTPTNVGFLSSYEPGRESSRRAGWPWVGKRAARHIDIRDRM
jgi:hypothetical protein